MAVECDATGFHTMESRLELTGRVTQVRRAVKENVVGNSRLDFASILPAPAHLPVDVPDMKPYAGYAARLFLQDFLCGKGLDTKAMLREEREYLDRHKEVKAGPYLRGKELFLQGFRNVTKEGFYYFCHLTRPFSGFAAFWCLEEAFASCHHDPESFLELIASHERTYLQERGNTISMARWEDSRERFRQAFRPDSPAFQAFLADLWGVAGGPENCSCVYTLDYAAHLAFTTEGGIPHKVLDALARKYPGLIVIHYWNDTECPEICGCETYHYSRDAVA